MAVHTADVFRGLEAREEGAAGRPPLEELEQDLAAALANQAGPRAASKRCYVAGCVMPALAETGECAYHRVVRIDPGAFESQQSCYAVLAQAVYAAAPLPDRDYFATFAERERERRRIWFERKRQHEEA